MILGTGTDLVDIARIESLLGSKLGSRFVNRVLTTAEQAVFLQRQAQSSSRAVKYLATRFAAKEAFAKAMGCGIGSLVGFQDVQINNNSQGAPHFVFSHRLEAWMARRQVTAHVALSDERTMAMAFVVIESMP